MKPDLFTFPNTESGLALAWETTVSLRRAGFKTRLVEPLIFNYRVIRVIATPPARPNRKARGCEL